MKLSIGKCWGLLVFDLIGLAIAGYAYLLGFQIVQTLAHANAFIILMAFFVGIKIVILALYDLNRNLTLKNIPFIGGLITILGNGIIFAISFFLIPEVPFYFFIGLAIADFVMISLSHFLWWIIIGKEEIEKEPQEEKRSRQKDLKEKPKKSKKETKDKWFSQDSDDEYDSIFDSLLQKNQSKSNGQEEKEIYKPPIPARNIFEDEKKYETGEFLKDIRKSRNQSLEKPASQLTQELPIVWEADSFDPEEPLVSKEELGMGKIDNDFDSRERNFKEVNRQENKMKENNLGNNKSEDFGPLSESHKEPLLDKEKNDKSYLFEREKEFILDHSDEKKLSKKGPKLAISNDIKFDADEDNDFNSIEKRLELLFHEIEMSMEETHYLQAAISIFHEEVENYKPIKGDEKIIAAGSLIREKLKAIIDKQFVVDEVLDDLIHLSKVINKRIDDLDRIEAGLNKRKASLDQKEEILIGEKEESPKIGILPQELVVENLDSEYIVAEEDYETIQRYLKRIK